MAKIMSVWVEKPSNTGNIVRNIAVAFQVDRVVASVTTACRNKLTLGSPCPLLPLPQDFLNVLQFGYVRKKVLLMDYFCMHEF